MGNGKGAAAFGCRSFPVKEAAAANLERSVPIVRQPQSLGHAAGSVLRMHGPPRSRTLFHSASLFECLWLFVADGCSLGSVVHSVTIALRHFALGVDPTAAYWDFDLLDGHGGWRAEGCHITGSGGNTTTIHCTHHNNFAVLMVSSPIWDFYPSRIKCRPFMDQIHRFFSTTE